MALLDRQGADAPGRRGSCRIGASGFACAAELTNLPPEQIRVAVRYYAAYQAEIDEWIRAVDEELDRIRVAWEREQAVLRR